MRLPSKKSFKAFPVIVSSAMYLLSNRAIRSDLIGQFFGSFVMKGFTIRLTSDSSQPSPVLSTRSMMSSSSHVVSLNHEEIIREFDIEPLLQPIKLLQDNKSCLKWYQTHPHPDDRNTCPQKLKVQHLQKLKNNMTGEIWREN
jgi:hypothetical protein